MSRMKQMGVQFNIHSSIAACSRRFCIRLSSDAMSEVRGIQRAALSSSRLTWWPSAPSLPRVRFAAVQAQADLGVPVTLRLQRFSELHE